ncbi:DUF4351 domain-containing protein [Alcaligenaceae bacterium SJ-26]|nr:DUF4351 domain-containing protein [Alcaligenaceae bacterium SJ-26]
MNLQDQYYRRLFSSPLMVRALFAGILPPGLRDLVDIGTLEPLPTDYVSDRRRQRQGDRLWRVRRRDGQMLYLIIMLEHQSATDRMISVRVMGYCALMYEDLAMRRLLGPSGRLPIILPIVLYSGARRWREPRQVSELMDPAPPELMPYQPQMRYLLLDEGALADAGVLPADNLVSALFHLEHSRSIEETAQLLHTVLRLTDCAQGQELRRVFGAWARHVLLPRAAPATAALPDTEDLQEITLMMAAHPHDWGHKWRQEGRQEGEALLLARQLTRKFGPLSEDVQQRIRQAGTLQLEAWSINLLDAETLEAVFSGTD